MSERRAEVLQLFEPVPDETPSSVRSRARELSARYLQKDEGLPLAPGDAAGPYEVLEVLGSGGQAVVYKARHRQIGRHVALKVPRREVGDRLLREAELAAHLEHPSIARVEDIRLEGPVPFLVMELCEKGSLEDLLEEHPGGLPFERALPIARAVLEALAFAHEKGVIHRDVKPANILFDRNGVLKVSDFGIGTLARNDGLSASMDASERTLLAGTPLYVAPEQEDPSLRVDGRLDGRADLFSFGKVLFQLLTGASPRTMRPVSRLNGKLDPAWDEYVWKLVEERPENRFASARAALAAMPTGGARGARVEPGKAQDEEEGARGRKRTSLTPRARAIIASVNSLAGFAWAILALLWVFGGALSMGQFLCLGLGVQAVATLVTIWCKADGRVSAPPLLLAIPVKRDKVWRHALSFLLAAAAAGGMIGALPLAWGKVDAVFGVAVTIACFVALGLHIANRRAWYVFGIGLVYAGISVAATIGIEHVAERHREVLPIGVVLAAAGVALVVAGRLTGRSTVADGLVLATTGPRGERRLGGWTPAILKSDEPALVSIAVVFESAGDYEIEWSHERGAQGLWVESCALVADGSVLSSDEHRGWAGAGARDHVFRVKLETLKPGARHEIRSRIRPEGGIDSYGSIWIRRVGSV